MTAYGVGKHKDGSWAWRANLELGKTAPRIFIEIRPATGTEAALMELAEWHSGPPAEREQLKAILARAGLPRCGDHVLHHPTRETWVVAYADPATGDLAWLGWPDGLARLSDCEIVKACTDEEHKREVTGWNDLDAPDARRSHVLRLYGAVLRVGAPLMTLWCIHVPGPDDLFAMPDRAAADRCADEHNAFVTKRFLEDPDPSPNDPPLEAGIAEVIEWPWSAERHAAHLRSNVFQRRSERTGGTA